MPDTRFKSKRGFCKLCHKKCHDSEEVANRIIAIAPEELNLTYAYPCQLYPSGYWHVTSSERPFKEVTYRVALKKLGPKREQRLLQRITRILSL